jgi:hypothetical protein
MLPQGVLGLQYEAERSSTGVTSLAGLTLYLDLVHRCGLVAAIRQRVQVAGRQGWLDLQMVLAVVFLNLAGGDCVADLERLEQDRGFAAVLQAIERDLLSRSERRSLASRWRRKRERTVPSPSALSAWLERFHDPESPKACSKRRLGAVVGTAFIPAVTEALQGVWRVNQALLSVIQQHQPATVATLDMDAMLIETHKHDALHCYKGFKAYQPLNCWWAEQGTMLYSEFRDGNVPAGHEQLRVLRDSLKHLPANVTKVSLPLRQERGSSLGDEERPRRRATAVRVVRCQRRVVGPDDSGAQPEHRDEAAGAGRGLGEQTDEGAALPADRAAGPRGKRCMQADHSSECWR